MPIIRRIAQAHEHGHRALDLECLGALLCNGLKKQRQLRRGCVRAFQRIRQIHMRASGGQKRAPVAQGTADAQLTHRIRPDHQFKPVQIFRQGRRLARNGPSALLGFDAPERVVDNPEQIRPGPGRRVDSHDIRIRKTQRFSQVANQHVVYQPHLGMHHLNWGVIRPGVLAEIGIILREKVLVKIQPGILGPRERVRRHNREHAQEHIQRSGDFSACVRIRQNLQCPRQQIVLRVKGAYRALKRERIGAFTAAKQQRESHCLRVRICKLLVRRMWKEQLPPVPRELHEGRTWVAERVCYVIAQHPTQRRQQRGKALEIDLAPAVRGDKRLPREEIAQEAFDSVGVLRCGGIARQPDDLVDQVAVAVKCPLIAIGIEHIRHSREAFELIAVAPPKPGGGRTDARRFEFDISGERPSAVNRVIRSPDPIRQRRFPSADHIPPERTRRIRHKRLKRPAHLVFCLAEGDLRHLLRHRRGKVLQRRVD